MWRASRVFRGRHPVRLLEFRRCQQWSDLVVVLWGDFSPFARDRQFPIEEPLRDHPYGGVRNGSGMCQPQNSRIMLLLRRVADGVFYESYLVTLGQRADNGVCETS